MNYQRVNPTDPPTKRTKELLIEMLGERVLCDEMKLAIIGEMKGNELVQGQVSALIDFVKYYKRTPEAEAKRNEELVTEPGEYLHEGKVYEVVRAKAGHLYPLDEDGKFVKGLFPKLKRSQRVTSADTGVA